MSDPAPDSEESTKVVEPKPARFLPFVVRTVKMVVGLIALCISAPFGLGAAIVAIFVVAALVALAGGLVWSLLVAIVTAVLGLLLLAIAFIAVALAVAAFGFAAFLILGYIWSAIMATSKGTDTASVIQKIKNVVDS